MQVPNNMNKLSQQQEGQSVKNVSNATSNKKAYEMIKSALGQKDGLNYQNFSNVFTLQGTGNSKMGLHGLNKRSR